MIFSLRVNNDLSPAVLFDLATAAEEAGFDQLWVSNDLFLRSAPVLVGALAARTTTLRLGIAVMNPYTVHVGELAMVAGTLQEVSGGRFLLGIGAGSQEFLGWAGVERSRPLATTTEAVVTLRALLGHQDVDPDLLPAWFGSQSTLRFPFGDPVPVYLGAMGPRMLQMAGRCADGALPLLYPPEHYPYAREQVNTGLAAAGRAASRFDLPACFWVSVSADRDAGRAALAAKLAYYGPSISRYLLERVGLSPEEFLPAATLAQRGLPATDLIDERMLSLGIAGTAQDAVDRCRALQAMGAEHLSFGPPLGPDPLAAVRVLGTDVLPRLRGTKAVAVPGPA